MLNKSELVTIHKELTVSIDKLFACSKLLDEMKEKKHIYSFYIFSLEIFCWLSKEIEINFDYLNYKRRLNDILKTRVNINETKNFEFETINDLKDHINYIHLWMKNNYSVDLEEVKKEQLIQDFAVTRNLNTDNSGMSDGGLAVYKNIFNLTKVENLEEDNGALGLNELIKKTNAFEKLNQEIASGKIYIYLTKPKWNVFIKKILLMLLTVGMCVCVAFLSYVVTNMSKQTVVTDAAKSTMSKIFTISCLCLLFFLFASNSIVNGFKNDNYKYIFDKRLFFYYCLFAFVFVMMATSNDNSIFPVPSSIKTEGKIVFSIMETILVTVIFLNSAIYLLSYLYLNPAKNTKLIESFINQYSSEK